MDLKGRGSFSNSQGLFQILEFLLPKCLCFLRGFSFPLNFYINVGLMVIKNLWPFSNNPTQKHSSAHLQNLQGGRNHNLPLKTKPSELKAFMVKKGDQGLNSACQSINSELYLQPYFLLSRAVPGAN